MARQAADKHDIHSGIHSEQYDRTAFLETFRDRLKAGVAALEAEAVETAAEEEGPRTYPPAPVPDGLELLTEEQRLLWDQYTSQRRHWTLPELFLVHRIVIFEERIRHIYSTDIRFTESLVLNRHGEFVANPLFEVVAGLELRQRRCLADLQLLVAFQKTAKEKAPNLLEKKLTARQEEDKEKARTLVASDGLLAMPEDIYSPDEEK